jgi:hypothetical protein
MTEVYLLNSLKVDFYITHCQTVDPRMCCDK